MDENFERRRRRPTFAEQFTPKLVTVLREGYGLAGLRADLLAGLTVAIVALPLSMAIAIASGVTPDRGLYTAIVGGFIVSAFGGSRFQIGGPAGAFIVLVAATVADVGVDGLILATMLAGLILLALGFLRLGAYIKFIPYPVTVGFTAGVAVIIFASQLRELLGLTLPGAEPGEILPKIAALSGAIDTVRPSAVGVAAVVMMIILGLRRARPGWPNMLVAVTTASLVATVLSLPVETIGGRFGGIPHGLPMPALPEISVAKIEAVLPHAFAFALLGAIESLLSAVVADGMTGRRHRSNCELVAQGGANIASSLFGGICVTGTIARTATNVRAGAWGPVSGIFHAGFLLLFMVAAAPLASYIPLAALAGVLVVVAWDMVEKQAFATLLRASWGDALVLLATFLLTVFQDLTTGIVVGFSLGALLFIHRMAEGAEVEHGRAFAPEDVADDVNGDRGDYDPTLATDADVVIYRIKGAFFFGAASTVGAVLDRIGEKQRAFVVDFSGVPMMDSTAASVIHGFVRKAERRDVKVYVSGASPMVRRTLRDHGVRAPLAEFAGTIEEAVAAAHVGVASNG